MIGSLVSIDPGVHGYGYAVFCGGLLEEAGRLIGGEVLPYRGVETVVCEVPQIYRASRSKGDPNDLVDLAFAAGRIVERAQAWEVVTVRPHAWKGGTKKPKRVSIPYVIETRCRRVLSPQEVMNIKLPRNVKHTYDVFDAVGIGLHYLRRLR